MRKSNMVLIGFLAGILLFSFMSVNVVSAKSVTPLASELDVQLTYFTPYNSEYKLADPLISGNNVDLMFLEGIRDDTTLDLGKSVWESTFSTITSNSVYSDTMGNNTWDTATSDGATVNTEATCNSAETLITFKATTNATAVAQYASTYSYYSWDGDGDGDLSDTADRSYLPHDENVFMVFNNEMTTDSTDASTYSLVNIALQTTTTSKYTISIKFWYTSGDAGWDFTGANGALLEIFDCSGQAIVGTIDVAAVLDADTTESHNILGTDYNHQYLYCDEASKYVQNEIKNLAYYTSMPAFTDASDSGTIWDIDGSDEYISGIDGTDYLFTIITQDTTDTFDNSQELLLDQSGYITTLIPARYLYFTGVMAVYPSVNSNWGSTTVSTGKYLTTETLIFDTQEINSLTALANVLSVSTWKLNVTLDKDVCWDTDHYENNLISFMDSGLPQYDNFITAWTTSVDDSEVQYDTTDPSTTTGSVHDIVIGFYTRVSYTDSTVVTVTQGGGTTTSEASSNPLGFWIIVALSLVTLAYLKFGRD